MSGTLSVVATPIGNLEDITLRALRVLREANLIAAEDTRRTAKLLNHHGISVPAVSFHQHNTQTRIPQLITRLLAGNRIALVTDAGTPGVSDPGVELVQACIERGIVVDPVPGVNAPLTAALASGFPLVPLSIFGFVPARASDRRTWLQTVAHTPHTFTFFETPHRIKVTLDDATPLFGDRPMMIGRELTKRHQEFLWGTAGSLARQDQILRGELTIVIAPQSGTAPAAVETDDNVIAVEFGRLTDSAGYSRRDAVAAVAEKFQRATRDVYAAIERAKNSGG